MKKFNTTALLLFCSFNFFAQIPIDPCFPCDSDLNVEDDSLLNYISLDTVLANNIWTHGMPNKEIFNLGDDSSAVIITDTVENYPINNTSVFEVTWICSDFCLGSSLDNFAFGFEYKMDSDLGVDGGKIEISINNGAFRNAAYYQDWTQDTIQFFGYDSTNYVTSLNGPGISGSLHEEWNIMYFHSLSGNGGFQIPFKLRFTFASDSIQTNKEGWMIRGFNTSVAFLDTENIDDQKSIKVFPNPIHDEVTIRIESLKSYRYILFNSEGQKIKEDEINDFATIIDMDNITTGVYLIMIYDGKGNYYTQKVIKI